MKKLVNILALSLVLVMLIGGCKPTAVSEPPSKVEETTPASSSAAKPVDGKWVGQEESKSSPTIYFTVADGKIVSLEVATFPKPEELFFSMAEDKELPLPITDGKFEWTVKSMPETSGEGEFILEAKFTGNSCQGTMFFPKGFYWVDFKLDKDVTINWTGKPQSAAVIDQKVGTAETSTADGGWLSKEQSEHGPILQFSVTDGEITYLEIYMYPLPGKFFYRMASKWDLPLPVTDNKFKWTMGPLLPGGVSAVIEGQFSGDECKGTMTFPKGVQELGVMSQEVTLNWTATRRPNWVVGLPPPVQDDFKYYGIFTSPNHRRIIYSGIDGYKQWVAVDNLDNKKYYDDVAFPITGNDPKHNGYNISNMIQPHTVMSDNTESKPWDKNDFEPYPLFSPDSKHFTYAANIDDKWFAVVDGIEGKKYDYIDWLCYSPDSQHLAYAAKVGNKSVMVVDGKEIKQYDDISSPSFSIDSKQISYHAKVGGNWLTVTGGVESNGEKTLVAVSPDKRHVAYHVYSGDDSYFEVDGKVGKSYRFVSDFTFSFDGAHYAYVVSSGEGYFVVKDGIESKIYPKAECQTPALSPDGSSLAFIVRQDAAAFVVINGVEGKPYLGIYYPPVFSADGKRLVYVAYTGSGGCIVENGQDGKTYNSVSSYIFSPDGQHLAYKAKIGNKYTVVFDGQEGKLWDDIRTLALSPDSRHLAYEAKSGDKWLVVIDGRESKPYDRLVERLDYHFYTSYTGGTEDFLFESSNKLVYYAIEGTTVILVEEKLG